MARFLDDLAHLLKIRRAGERRAIFRQAVGTKHARLALQCAHKMDACKAMTSDSVAVAVLAVRGS
ncbi:hypothetical protein [Pseudoxanthomonas winnipegensis]|uniref:hypothetical protein n=1 Tax=Pseudoxanthomonas winnipegensis TaxID=2480810 RepID=UPI0010395259|nr:hypothetical protein [Pseudoxanthomonas winnipegensis]TBV75147.1 hypothetical protein EYC45_07835 [Pseudoxanthomonas winnipegensis]